MATVVKERAKEAYTMAALGIVSVNDGTGPDRVTVKDLTSKLGS